MKYSNEKSLLNPVLYEASSGEKCIRILDIRLIYLGYKQRVVDMSIAIHKRRLDYILDEDLMT
ncbi:hypothetical protein RO3G_12656 [Rhizopus delemar RA 99-880]|uniref:Uncharacterized protein n=1 Tax=Rhizopus delemar (strain RA 99-880 / ATCC MYA-4621 / FGSC 9543 / NRRL 43880) TaxID=246409 RepID=I1CHL5_RHIO9|nr:hypothetical protein RO3G_12656 [Rhizopus delemar RA 99-880]|eukprot:EIE87945.1 hypothetical protein RO3G_12656 [Rhizopus delemar RA 99-880]